MICIDLYFILLCVLNYIRYICVAAVTIHNSHLIVTVTSLVGCRRLTPGVTHSGMFPSRPLAVQHSLFHSQTKTLVLCDEK